MAIRYSSARKRWSGKKIATERKLGIIGGTFDPPHIGHLLLAEVAREQLGLEKVLFLPAGQPPHKQRERITLPAHRVAMTKLAIAGNPAFQVDVIDIERPSPHYTATLLPLLKARFPAHELWLLIGGDSLQDLLSWHQPESVVRQCYLGVMPRPGAVIDWEVLFTAIPAITNRFTSLDGPSVAISASQIRRRIAAGQSLRYMVPSSVISFIAEHQLYSPDR